MPRHSPFLFFLFQQTCKYLKKEVRKEMGPISDIIDTVKSIGSAAKLGGATIFSPTKSISARAMDGTCVFPMVVDGELIPIDDALTIARAWERTCSSFVLTSLTMSPFLNVTDGETPSAAEYVKRFHVNMAADSRYGNSPVGLNLESFDQDCARIGVDYHVLESSAAAVAFNIYQGIHSELAKRQLAMENFVVEEFINPSAVNDLYIVQEARGPGRPRPNPGPRGNARVNPRSGAQSPSITNNVNPTITVTVPGQAAPRRRLFDDRRAFDHKVDSEFRKANDLVPTMLHIRIYPITDNKESGGEAIDFVLGIKCQLHPVTTDQMVTELARGIKNNDTFFNFIKWTTGETKFFRDFLFAMDQQKADAYQSVRGDNASIIVASKRRKNIAKVWNRLADNPLTPILSILVAQDDLDILRDEFGYDVEKMPTLLRTLMSNFYLLGFMNLNLASERVDILIDGQTNPQTYTLSTLAKENTTDDRKFKEMMKMMGRRI